MGHRGTNSVSPVDSALSDLVYMDHCAISPYLSDTWIGGQNSRGGSKAPTEDVGGFLTPQTSSQHLL